MKAVDDALYALLDGDGQLRSLAPGGVHRGTGEQDAATPFITFSQEQGDYRYTFGDSWHPLIYAIKAVDQSADAAAAYAVKDRIATLLAGGGLALAGHRALLVRLMSDIEYEEPGERPWQHVGGRWEITVQ